jgi:hypothetical protein
MIHHILKDGTEVTDIAGHVIKAEQFEVLYQTINRINERVNHEALRTSETRFESSTGS